MLRAHRKYRAPVRVIHDCDFVSGVLRKRYLRTLADARFVPPQFEHSPEQATWPYKPGICKENNIIIRHTQHAKKAARSRIKKVNIKLVKLMLPNCDPYNLPSQEQAQIKAHMQLLRGVVEFHVDAKLHHSSHDTEAGVKRGDHMSPDRKCKPSKKPKGQNKSISDRTCKPPGQSDASIRNPFKSSIGEVSSHVDDEEHNDESFNMSLAARPQCNTAMQARIMNESITLNPLSLPFHPGENRSSLTQTLDFMEEGEGADFQENGSALKRGNRKSPDRKDKPPAKKPKGKSTRYSDSHCKLLTKDYSYKQHVLMYGPYVPFLHCTRQKGEQDLAGTECPKGSPSKKQSFNMGNSNIS